jgi:hypothetical protein
VELGSVRRGHQGGGRGRRGVTGPPVRAAFSAISESGRGSNAPALVPARCAAPSRQSTRAGDRPGHHHPLHRGTGCGRAIHPCYVEGQIQGGAVQGIGWANDEYIYNKNGKMDHPGLPLPGGIGPADDPILVEVPNPHHPFGARGVDEVPIVPSMAVAGDHHCANLEAVGTPAFVVL